MQQDIKYFLEETHKEFGDKMPKMVFTVDIKKNVFEIDMIPN